MEKHTLIALMEDKPGVLNRVSNLFRRRNYNIRSLAVGHSETQDISRLAKGPPSFLQSKDGIIEAFVFLQSIRKALEMPQRPPFSLASGRGHPSRGLARGLAAALIEIQMCQAEGIRGFLLAVAFEDPVHESEQVFSDLARSGTTLFLTGLSVFFQVFEELSQVGANTALP